MWLLSRLTLYAPVALCYRTVKGRNVECSCNFPPIHCCLWDPVSPRSINSHFSRESPYPKTMSCAPDYHNAATVFHLHKYHHNMLQGKQQARFTATTTMFTNNIFPLATATVNASRARSVASGIGGRNRCSDFHCNDSHYCTKYTANEQSTKGNAHWRGRSNNSTTPHIDRHFIRIIGDAWADGPKGNVHMEPI